MNIEVYAGSPEMGCLFSKRLQKNKDSAQNKKQDARDCGKARGWKKGRAYLLRKILI